MADEVITHDDVLRWLPSDVRDALIAAMAPDVRGWYTAEEAAASSRRFVEVRSLGDRAARYIATD